MKYCEINGRRIKMEKLKGVNYDIAMRVSKALRSNGVKARVKTSYHHEPTIHIYNHGDESTRQKIKEVREQLGEDWAQTQQVLWG